ncbi:MAG: chemotaxis protein CheX [Desulfobulbaceae bacterium]|jgi:chemotaxis protein CheX|nr:chemotaxis protein CheX [Desulfobulbaceae bacterium]
MEISEQLAAAVAEIFSTMIMMDVTVVQTAPERTSTFTDSISGVIGLAGTQKGVLALHFPVPVALAVTSSFLGMEVAELGPDVEDAIGELANMLGGSVKTMLTDKGRDIQLSMPTTISGGHYDFQSLNDALRHALGFHTDAGDFLVELQLER